MKDYTSYTIDDFFADAGFVEWVLCPHPDSPWENVCLKNEQAGLARQLIQHIQFKQEANIDKKTEATWLRVEQSISTKSLGTQKPNVIMRYLYMAGAIAASLIVGFILFKPSSSFVVQDKEGTYALAGSSCVLGSQSSIEYDISVWENERSVTLNGQASFKVNKGSPFKVLSEEGTVSVLGTEFNVDARGGHFYVAVDEGLVAVSSQLHEQLLEANQGYARNAQLTENFIEMFGSRKNAPITMHFQNTSLTQIIAVLEWQKGIRINLADTNEQQRFTGFYVANEKLDVILNIITWPLNLKYEIVDASNVRIF